VSVKRFLSHEEPIIINPWRCTRGKEHTSQWIAERCASREWFVSEESLFLARDRALRSTAKKVEQPSALLWHFFFVSRTDWGILQKRSGLIPSRRDNQRIQNTVSPALQRQQEGRSVNIPLGVTCICWVK